MSRARIPLELMTAAGLLLFALAFSGWAWRRSVHLEKSARRKNDQWRELVRLQYELDALEQAYVMWSRLDRARLTPLENILRRVASDLPMPELTERGTEPLSEGWQLRRVEAVFPDIPLTEVSRFLMLCAEERPPWKPTRMQVTASPSGRGYGQVRLILEGIERVEDVTR